MNITHCHDSDCDSKSDWLDGNDDDDDGVKLSKSLKYIMNFVRLASSPAGCHVWKAINIEAHNHAVPINRTNLWVKLTARLADEVMADAEYSPNMGAWKKKIKLLNAYRILLCG